MIRRPPRSTLFPTRRSSDLDRHGTLEHYIAVKVRLLKQASKTGQIVIGVDDHDLAGLRGLFQQSHLHRSEEHTSELQSPDHLVCRLLLEKKKKSEKHRSQMR